MVAFAQYFDNPWLGLVRNASDASFPSERPENRWLKSIRSAREALQKWGDCVYFSRRRHQSHRRNAGVSPRIPVDTQGYRAPVVPAYLDGLWGSIFSYEGGRFFWKFPKQWRYPVSIRFGRPIQDPESVEQVQQAVADLRAKTLTQRHGFKSRSVTAGRNKASPQLRLRSFASVRMTF